MGLRDFQNDAIRKIDKYFAPDWDDGGKCHNWRNYIDDDWKEIWQHLSNEGKYIAFTMAQGQADLEKWD